LSHARREGAKGEAKVSLLRVLRGFARQPLLCVGGLRGVGAAGLALLGGVMQWLHCNAMAVNVGPQ
jgi:hypothetical protein